CVQATFDPRLFLDDLSARAQRLVPHYRMLVPYLEDDDGTATVFAEHSPDDVLFHEGRSTTHFHPPGRSGTIRDFARRRRARASSPPESDPCFAYHCTPAARRSGRSACRTAGP